MKDHHKTKEQLIRELVVLRKQVAEIGKADERKTKRQTLLANERLHYLLSATTAVIYSAKTSGDYGATFISNNVNQMTGFRSEDFLNKSNFWIDRVHPDDSPVILKKLDKLFDRDFLTYEYRFLIKNGTYIWVRDEMKLVRDDEGKPIEIIGYWVDISLQKKSEMALRESEEKFRLHAEHLPNIIFINRRGNIIYANHQCEKIMGYTIKEFYSPDFDFFSMIAPEYQDLIKENYIKHSEGKELLPYEFVILTKKGRRIDVLLSTKLISYENEMSILGIMTDITERKKAEKVLKKSQWILEQKVKERTKEISTALLEMEKEIKVRKQAESELKKTEEKLRKSQAKLQKQTLSLEQKNITLKEIIAQIEIEKRKIKEDVSNNVDTVLSPILESLKGGKTSLKYVQLLEHHLEELASSFGSRVNENRARLTPREIEICSMIKGGLTSKDISKLLNISCQTVERHRKNIRRKFLISNRGVNLTSFLREL